MGILAKLSPLGLVIVAVIVTIMIVAVFFNFLVRKKYKQIGQALDNRKHGDKSVHNVKILDSIVDEYRVYATTNPEDLNTQAIIEKHFNSELKVLYLGERFIKNAVSLMIILGLLGTFYGLTLSIGKLVELLNNSANLEALNSMDSIVMGLIESVKGMSVAFTTSLFGIASSIILTILNIIFNVEEIRESLMVEIEEYLDNKVALEYRHKKVNEYTLLTDAIKSTFEQLGGRIEGSFKEVLDYSGDNMANAAAKIETSSLSLLKSVEHFDQSLKNFRENTRDFSEFNYNLRTNIERMNVAFADFTDDLKNNTRDITKNQEAIREAVASIETVEKK